MNSRRLLDRLAIDGAIFYSALSVASTGLMAIVLLWVATCYLSAEEQGFYFTFGSLLALQVFVELGLATVIVQFASQEFATVTIDAQGRLHGDIRAVSRLASLLRFSLRWYSACAIIIAFALNVAGYAWLSAAAHSMLDWQLPWFTLCLITGVAVLIAPVLSLIEGADRVESICKFRFVQGLLSSLTVVCCFLAGLGLYALTIAALVRLIAGVVFVTRNHGTFVRDLLRVEVVGGLDWRTEIWPFQWRIAVRWLAGYFLFSLLTPVMFHYHGPITAGQTGLTWAAVSMVGTVACCWINTAAPRFGVLVANRRYVELDRMFTKRLCISAAVSVVLSVIVWLAIYWLHLSGLQIGSRLLPMLPMSLLLLFMVVDVVIDNLASYLRAYKREPMMMPTVVAALLTAASTWWLGALYGPTGAAAGFLAIGVFWTLPSAVVVFLRHRRAGRYAVAVEPVAQTSRMERAMSVT